MMAEGRHLEKSKMGRITETHYAVVNLSALLW